MVIMLGNPGFSLAEAPTVAVLYPEIREPYRSVFRNIIRGIESGLTGPLKEYVLKEGDGIETIRHWLEKEDARVVISLGNGGLAVAKNLPQTVPVVVGAVFLSPNSNQSKFAGITLHPDPERLFDRLKILAPGVTRVTVIYNPEINGWLIDRSRGAARQHGLELNALPAENLRESATLYRDVLRHVRNGSEAVWLPQDDVTLDERTMLPLILKEAWDKSLLVFSSNPSHVRKGVLFSLYPDNVGLGRSLAEVALSRLQSNPETPAWITPLRDLLIAVNLRTAEHLGLNFSVQERRGFDLVFPSP